MSHRERHSQEPAPPVVEVDQCTGSSVTGAGHQHQNQVFEFFHDYMAWFRQKFTPNG